MALILNIETTSDRCSVALGKNGMVSILKESDVARSHAALITNFALEAVQEAGYSLNDLDAVAISRGPGSFTGLRIGLSAAKGLGYALDKPLIGIDTHQSMAWEMSRRINIKEKIYSPLIDARRMDVYGAFLRYDNTYLIEPFVDTLTAASFSDVLSKHEIVFFGTGSVKCGELIKHDNAQFVHDFKPSSEHMIGLSENKYQSSDFKDIAYLEPLYIKDFHTT